MNWGHLLFSFQGRINRAKFWLALVVNLVLIGIALSAYVPLEGSGADWLVVGAAIIVTIWIGLAVAIKRLHDRDKTGWWLILYYLVPGVLNGIGEAFDLSGVADTSGYGSVGAVLVLSLVALAISIWALVDLGFLKGTQGPNRFGPDPLGAEMADAVM